MTLRVTMCEFVHGMKCEEVCDLVSRLVPCFDCVWFTNSSHYGAYCTNFGSPLGDDYDGFCSFGERRES